MFWGSSATSLLAMLWIDAVDGVLDSWDVLRFSFFDFCRRLGIRWRVCKYGGKMAILYTFVPIRGFQNAFSGETGGWSAYE